MANFIENAFAWILTISSEVITTIVHTAEHLFGIGGAVVAIILISAAVHKAR